MKKTVPIFVIVFSAMIASCTVFLPQLRLTGVMLIGESERKTNFVAISVQPGWDNPGEGHKRITGFYVEFRNTTNDPVFIVWGKSTLKYNNGAFSPFVQGQRYEDFSKPMDAMFIPPNGIVWKYIYSSQQPYREAGKSGNWKLRPIEADQVILVFCVQSRDIVDYYTIEVR
jgi:hypothetical protein